MKDRVRIGAGAGFSGDRIDPAVVLAERGALDYLVFECLAERTVALAVRERARDPESGFDPYLEERMSEAQAAELLASLTKKFGGVKLKSHVSVDPSLIGGVRVTVGDEVFDTSIKAQLERMRVSLMAG